MKKVKNLDGFMIGRGSFGNSMVLSSMRKSSYIIRNSGTNGIHALKLVETKGEHKGNLEIRKHLVQYLKNFPGVKNIEKD